MGEIHGGEDITKMLESYIPLVEGQKIADYRQVITTIRKKVGWQKEMMDRVCKV